MGAGLKLDSWLPMPPKVGPPIPQNLAKILPWAGYWPFYKGIKKDDWYEIRG